MGLEARRVIACVCVPAGSVAGGAWDRGFLFLCFFALDFSYHVFFLTRRCKGGGVSGGTEAAEGGGKTNRQPSDGQQPR